MTVSREPRLSFHIETNRHCTLWGLWGRTSGDKSSYSWSHGSWTQQNDVLSDRLRGGGEWPSWLWKVQKKTLLHHRAHQEQSCCQGSRALSQCRHLKQMASTTERAFSGPHLMSEEKPKCKKNKKMKKEKRRRNSDGERKRRGSETRTRSCQSEHPLKKKRFFSRETCEMHDSSFHLTSHMEAKSLLPLQGYFFKRIDVKQNEQNQLKSWTESEEVGCFDRTWRRRHELEDCDCDWTHSTPAVGLTEKERRKERRNEKACRKVQQLCGAFPRCIAAFFKTLAASGDLAPPCAAEEIGGNQNKPEEHVGG